MKTLITTKKMKQTLKNILGIGAITLFFIVFAKGKMSDEIKRHEAIHFQQMLETLLIFSLLTYAYDWIKGLIKYRNKWDGPRDLKGTRYTSVANKAYYRIRMEQEAYACQGIKEYLSSRKRYRWLLRYKV